MLGVRSRCRCSPLNTQEPRVPRAITPEEAVRAFKAAECLDRFKGRRFGLAPVFKVMLVTAPRVGWIVDRDVRHFHREDCRIDFGWGNGNKQWGAGAVDPQTCAELADYIGGRASGPLFVGPRGGRLNRYLLIDFWREAFSLGLLDLIWPESESRDFETAYLVNRALISGKVCASKGGNPKLGLTKTKAEARREVESKVKDIVGRVQQVWFESVGEGMYRINLHGFRVTHQSWAEAPGGVQPLLVDKQLGHRTRGGDAALKAAQDLITSAVGRKHYLDLASSVFDASASARAVREWLDEAKRLQQGKTFLKFARSQS